MALVRAKPGELNWAGVTGANSFMFEAWLKANKLDMKKLPIAMPSTPAATSPRTASDSTIGVAIAHPQVEPARSGSSRC